MSGLGIPEILMNIMTCHEYTRSPNSSVIISFHNELVPYYISKVFYPVEKEDGMYNNIPEAVMDEINGVGIYKDDHTMKTTATTYAYHRPTNNYLVSYFYQTYCALQ